MNFFCIGLNYGLVVGSIAFLTSRGISYLVHIFNNIL